MSKLLISFLLVCYLGIISGDHHLIAAGCDTDKTCINFGTCTVTTNPTSPNIGTFYTENANQILFQIQYDNSNAGWIAMGLSETPNMPESFIFLCHREADSGVNIQQRYAVARSRPPLVTSQLTAVSSSNSGSLLNCSFTAPVAITATVSENTIQLNNPAGYYVLLAWGAFSDGNIQQHGGSTAARCASANRIVVSAASSIIPTIQCIYVMLALLFASYIFV